MKVNFKKRLSKITVFICGTMNILDYPYKRFNGRVSFADNVC